MADLTAALHRPVDRIDTHERPVDRIDTHERPVDRIDSNARFADADAARLNQLYQDADTLQLLSAVIHDRVAGEGALVSSFGAESAVLLHLVAAIDPAIPVLFLDTQKHFAETLAYRTRLAARLGLINVIDLRPDPAQLAQRDANGLRWSYDPDGCCDIRKVQPLAKALARFDATITGRKGFQASTRTGLARFELDRTDAAGRLKVNPLADWDAARIAAYIAEHDLPPHPLVAEGFPSIGCSPCTSKVAAGEDPRAGRWRGWDKVECGIHVPDGAFDGQVIDVPAELPPGYDPAF